MAPKKTKIADTVMLEALAYEFAFNDKTDIERKIKSRLRYRGLQPYQQERVDLLRRLKDKIQGEVHRRERSRYYVGCHGKFAALDDFDIERMIEDFRGSFPDVPHKEIAWFVPFAVYLYYLR